MKRNQLVLRGIMAVALSFVVLLTTSNFALAANSDQVVLSINKPGAGSVTATSGLNVRNSASTSGSIVGYLPYGTNIMILERLSNGWDKVQYDIYGNVGYVNRSYIYEYSLSNYLTVSTSGDPLYFRTGSGTEYSIIASIPNGRSLPELIFLGTWSNALWGNMEGYVNNGYTIRTHY